MLVADLLVEDAAAVARAPTMANERWNEELKIPPLEPSDHRQLERLDQVVRRWSGTFCDVHCDSMQRIWIRTRCYNLSDRHCPFPKRHNTELRAGPCCCHIGAGSYVDFDGTSAAPKTGLPE